MDLYGIITITCGVVCLLLPLNWGGNQYAWSSPLVIVLFFVAAGFAIAFVYIELKVAKNPVIPMDLFKIRNFVVSSLFLPFLSYFILFILLFYFDQYIVVLYCSILFDAGLFGNYLLYTSILSGLFI
jgi:Fungal trichothecene efflux pump (TRI12)